MTEYYFLTINYEDIFISIVVFLGIFLHAFLKKDKYIDSKPYYVHFIPGVWAKLIGGLSFCLIYLYYYRGGDTIDYFSGAVAMNNLLLHDPISYFDLMINPVTWEKYQNYFTPDTLWPPSSLVKKSENFNVIRIASIFSLLTFKSFLASTLLFAYFCYLAVWKVYEMFCTLFPNLQRYFAIAFLYTPSYCFWGSGIMKDTIAVFCISIIVVAFYQVFLSGKRNYKNIPALLISAFLLYNIKPYLLVALVPGLTFWASFDRLNRIKNVIVRFLSLPVILVISFLFLFNVYLRSGSGGYGTTTDALKQATIIQQDLIRSEAYGDNNYDIGTFDASLSGVLGKAPLAISAGLFMPFIWDARSLVMFFSGLENLILLVFTIYSLVRLRIFGLFTATFKDPILTLCFTFALFISFIIGLTTANFGALVRYKIPMLPYFTSYFIILTYLSNRKFADIEADRAKLRGGIKINEEKDEFTNDRYINESYMKAEFNRKMNVK